MSEQTVLNVSSLPKIAVILCAYTEERWNDLVEAVSSVEAGTVKPDQIIIVIDHNRLMFERASTTFANAIVLENAYAKGLSGARNTGILAADAQLIGFLDDDAAAAPDWLEKLSRVMIENPNVLGVSGWVLPAWLSPRPRWFPDEFNWVVGCTHRGVPTKRAEIRNLIGASMLIRCSVFETVGGFRTEIGRVGAIPLGCEETELCIRARQNIPGGVFMIEPAAVISHKVPAKRARWSYFQSRCYAEGVSKAVVAGYVGSKDALSAERAHAFKTLPLGVLRGITDGLRGDLSGFKRVSAVIAGFFITALGYLRGKRVQNPLTNADTDDQRPLRILMVSARYYPLTGGTETHVYEVSRRLAADGHDVTVLTTDAQGDLPSHETAAGVKIIRVKAYPRGRDYYFAPGMLSVIAAGKWDVVHLQGYHTLVAPIAMFAAWVSRKPFAVTFHSGGHSSSVRTRARRLQRMLLRPLFSRAAQLIGVSHFEADFFAESLGFDRSRFEVIPNGSHLPSLETPITVDSQPLIVSSGRLERYKGHHHVIAALPHVLQERSDVRLRIVGSGPYEATLRSLAHELGVEDRVEIRAIPSGNRQGMAELLSRSSLVVLFSEYEAHPVAVMEALSLKRPVLVADTSGLHELAQQGWVSALPIDCTPDQLAAAIIRQIDQPLSPVDVTLPTWEGCAAALLLVYRKIAH